MRSTSSRPPWPGDAQVESGSSDGNCRACMVEVEGERVLAASRIRHPAPGMEVRTDTERARHSRRGVFELLLADQPPRETAREHDSRFWGWTERIGLDESRFPVRDSIPAPDSSHPAMRVAPDACIQCNLCVRACREVQVNNVIGMAWRGQSDHVAWPSPVEQRGAGPPDRVPGRSAPRVAPRNLACCHVAFIMTR